MRGRSPIYDKSPIGILFRKNEKSKPQVKVIRNKNIDEIIELNYELPGIPGKAIIDRVVIGEKLCEQLIKDKNLK